MEAHSSLGNMPVAAAAGGVAAGAGAASLAAAPALVAIPVVLPIVLGALAVASLGVSASCGTDILKSEASENLAQLARAADLSAFQNELRAHIATLMAERNAQQTKMPNAVVLKLRTIQLEASSVSGCKPELGIRLEWELRGIDDSLINSGVSTVSQGSGGSFDHYFSDLPARQEDVRYMLTRIADKTVQEALN